MYHRHKTRAKAFLDKQYPGIKHIKGEFKQNRFLYILDKKYKRQFDKNLKMFYCLDVAS